LTKVRIFNIDSLDEEAERQIQVSPRDQAEKADASRGNVSR
jgi:hypothetical protein